MNTSSGNKLYLLLSVFLFLSCTSINITEKNRIPLWADTETINQYFPEDKYIARIGYGDTEEAARLNADAELSNFFNHVVSVQINAEENAVSNNGNSEISRSINRTIDISSNAELVALRHTEFWLDTSRNRFVNCAYINKEEAWKILQSKLEGNAASFEQLYQESRLYKESFHKIFFLNKALSYSDSFYDYYYLAKTLDIKEVQKYSTIIKDIQCAKIECQKLKLETTIELYISGDSTGRIKTKITELFSKEGFPVGRGKATYNAEVKVKIEISESVDICIFYPQISISIKNKKGIEISTWAKDLNKVSAYNKEACERMCLSKIEKEIESNFIQHVLSE